MLQFRAKCSFTLSNAFDVFDLLKLVYKESQLHYFHCMPMSTPVVSTEHP